MSDIAGRLRALADGYEPLLISWNAKDGVLRCRDHGTLTGIVPELSASEGILMLEHLGAAHGMDVERALSRVREVERHRSLQA